MKFIPIILIGFGPVGQALVSLIREKSAELRIKYNLDLNLRAILRRASAFLSFSDQLSDDFNLIDKLNDITLWQKKPPLDWLLNQSPTGVLFEVTDSDLKTGQPGYDHIKQALQHGWHVITANKGPLLLYYSELHYLAKIKNLKLKFSGATAAALPALDIGRICLAGSKILKIEGILNGTTNFILTKMGEGFSYNEGLKEAQEKGIAEKNPAYDLEGWDTAVKLALLAAALLDTPIKLEEIEIEGITQIRTEEVSQVLAQGKKIKLLGKLYFQNGRLRASVGPEVIDQSHPLFLVDYTNKGLTFYTDTMGEITIIGGRSNPRGAAAAMLKDLINIYHPF
ncbi:MAG: homoserine dehydrogenase [Candidatus Aminicenantes bacterium]|nr:homoserine dehydrogenase [Candidatus Aminicenantes bacterium]